MTRKDVIYELEKRDEKIRKEIESIIEKIEMRCFNSAVDDLKDLMKDLED